MTAEERRIERAKKFNTNLSAEDRKKLRAQRFGTSTGGSASIKPSTENSAALQKRAERFGIPVKSGSAISVHTTSDEAKAKLKERAERFGGSNVTNLTVISTGKVAISIDDSKQKLLKRKERFGAGATTQEEVDEKKKKRAERFKI